MLSSTLIDKKTNKDKGVCISTKNNIDADLIYQLISFDSELKNVHGHRDRSSVLSFDTPEKLAVYLLSTYKVTIPFLRLIGISNRKEWSELDQEDRVEQVSNAIRYKRKEGSIPMIATFSSVA